MKRMAVSVLALVTVGMPAWRQADLKAFRQAIAAVMADSLTDSSAVRDRLGYEHKVRADSTGLWYRTTEPVPLKAGREAPAIRLLKEPVRNPLLLLVTDDAGQGPMPKLVILWRTTEPDGPRVLLRTRRLDGRFYVWSEPVDVTPPSTDRR